MLTGANGFMAVSPEALSTSNKRARYVIYPRRMRQPGFRVELSSVRFVTEWWVEDCALYKRLLPIQPDHITTMPFTAIPIPGTSALPSDFVCTDAHNCAEFAGLNMVTAGMDERERERWTTLIELVGANYDTKISREADMLVSPDVTLCAKYWYAVENNISVLRSTWFVECMKKGAVVDYGQHLLESLGRHGARRPADCTDARPKEASAKSILSEDPQFANLEWVVRKDDATYVAPTFRKRRNSLSPGDALTLMREAEERTRDAKRQRKAAARREKSLAGRTEEEAFEADRLTRVNPEHEKLPWIVPVPGAEMVLK